MTPVTATRALLAAAVLVALAGVYTHPVLLRSGAAIASDPYDPVLNASILWWNATTPPFTRAWWTPPHYYPSQDVAAFTEALVGLSPIATPLFWLTGDPLRTYNIVFVLTWPLSGLAAYLLVFRLTRRHDASTIAALAFAFAPYRLTQIAHLQVLACFWLPLALAGLHAYAETRRRRWLVLFGAAWLLQSLTNGYFLLFGAVLIGLWVAYFCFRSEARGLARSIVAAWAFASLPLVPVMLKYRAVHAAHGLRRTMEQALFFSADAWDWIGASSQLVFWSRFLGQGGPEASLFPGVTAVALVLVACGWHVMRAAHDPAPGRRRPARYAALAVAALGVGAAGSLLAFGPWRVEPFGVPVRMSGLGRALLLIVGTSAALVALTPGLRAALRRRSPLVFYSATTLIVAAFCMGPVIRAGGHVILDPGPYAWLMALPGFDGLRVPARFWMLGALCLAVAAGLAFASLVPRRGRGRSALLALVAAGVLLDGWRREMPMASPPADWSAVARPDVPHALVELPLGQEFDAAATYRAVGHRRRVVNGVSGHEPSHYGLLRGALDARDPAALLALTQFGPLDVIVDRSADPDDGLVRYVAALPGAVRLYEEDTDRRTLFRLPSAERPAEPEGSPIAFVAAAASEEAGLAMHAIDGDPSTFWIRYPQTEGLWLRVDLGEPHDVTAVVHSLGRHVDAYPGHLEIHTSLDGTTWAHAWSGPTLAPALEAAMRDPVDARMVLTFEPRTARFVRLRAAASEDRPWVVVEVGAYGRDSKPSTPGARAGEVLRPPPNRRALLTVRSPHEEGTLTSLGRVVRGMDVVDRLELRAIAAARIVPGSRQP